MTKEQRFRIRVLAVVLLVSGCVSRPVIPEGAIVLRDDVFIEALSANVWRHVSTRWFPGVGTFASNGVILRADNGKVLVVDSAWNPEQTAAVFDWIEENIGRISSLIVTHAHDDRLGGISEAHRRGVNSIALRATAAAALMDGWPAIGQPVETGFPLDALGVRGEIFFPGPAHTIDNAVVYFEAQGLLVGGCMVRSLSAQTMGNTADANLDAWPVSIRALQSRYPAVQTIVPGHGSVGDKSLLSHTLDVLESQGR